jgi:glycosyltransferase involved in cell wall biosynthesis
VGDVDQPAIAVVVPTFGRADLLPQLVDGLASQQLSERFEVIIVDDCSSDATQDVLAELAAVTPLSLRVLRTDRNRGPALARNLGWQATTAPLVAFTDDDCVPTVHWLAELFEAVVDADVVQGRTMPNPAQADRLGPFSRSLDVPAMTPFFETANICYRRALLERLGGFDETFALAAGEDTDLAKRALASGAQVVFSPTAIVHHEVHPSSFFDTLAKTRSFEGLVQVVVRYPDLRQYFDGRFIWFRRHRLALLAAVGVAASVPSGPRWQRRAAVGGLLCLPYARHRVMRESLGLRRRECLARLPQLLAIDLAELAHTTFAQWRYRGTGGHQ